MVFFLQNDANSEKKSSSCWEIFIVFIGGFLYKQQQGCVRILCVLLKTE